MNLTCTKDFSTKYLPGIVFKNFQKVGKTNAMIIQFGKRFYKRIKVSPSKKNNQIKNMLDEPVSSEPKLEDIFLMPNPTLSSMDTYVAEASKTL